MYDMHNSVMIQFIENRLKWNIFATIGENDFSWTAFLFQCITHLGISLEKENVMDNFNADLILVTR